MNGFSYEIMKANACHTKFAEQICKEIESSAKQRGSGISKRTPELIIQKILEDKAVIAITDMGEWAGFCYIESWENDQFVSNSGLIIAPQFRKNGLARKIKAEIFNLSSLKFPNAKVFGLTTSSAVMKINSNMGYEPVIYSEITQDDKFWEGCKSCINWEILQSKNRKNCLCTALLFDPLSEVNENNNSKLISLMA